MKVLITGASGFLGSHVAERFVQAGHDVRALVRVTSDTSRLERLGVEIVTGDLQEPASLGRAVSGMDTVVHAAATMAGPPQEYVATTCEGTRALFEAARDADVKRVVYISSIVVLSMRAPEGGEPIPEDGPYEMDEALLSTYTQSKLEAEKIALEFSQRSDMDVLVLRPGLLFGPRGKMFLPRTGYGFGKHLYVVIGLGHNRLPVCYVGNCADAILLAADRTDVAEGVFNIVDDEPVKQIEYLKEIKHGVRRDLRIVRVPYTLARVIAFFGELAGKITGLPWPFRSTHMIQCHRRLRYRNTLAKERLGWQPATSKRDALDATTRYFASKESFSRRADIRFVGKPPAEPRTLRACLIGCGMIGQVHAQILADMPHAELVGVCDLDREAASKLANEYELPHAHTDPETMIRQLKPDVVHILTPPQTHADFTGIAAAEGCNVLAEKPMATSAQEARRMCDAADRHGVKLCVDHNHLFDPVMVETRKMLERNELGRVLWLESYYGFDLGHNRASRYMLPGGGDHWTFRIPGGLFLNLAPHPLCLFLDVLGPPTKISAHSRWGRILPHANSDELRIMLETGNASGVVSVSLAASPRFQTLALYGTEMCLFVDFLNKWVVRYATLGGLPKPISRALMNVQHARTLLGGTLSGMVKVFTKRWTPYDGVGILIGEFYRSILTGEPAPVTGEDGLRTIEILDEAWRQIGPLEAPGK